MPVATGVTVAVDGFSSTGATVATDSSSDVHAYEISVALSGIFAAVAVSVPLPLSKTVSFAGSMVTLLGAGVADESTTVTVRLT